MFQHNLLRGMPDYFAAIVSGCGGKPQNGWFYEYGQGDPRSTDLLAGLKNNPVPFMLLPVYCLFCELYSFAEGLESLFSKPVANGI